MALPPSRQSAARRQRALRARAAELAKELGRDGARVVFRFDDGWSVRRPTRLVDQRREGELMANCLRTFGRLDENLWSLRDPDNLPHACFAAWSIRQPGEPHGIDLEANIFIVTPRAVLLARGRGQSELKPAYARRLRSFAASAAAMRAAPGPNPGSRVARRSSPATTWESGLTRRSA